MRLLTIRHGLTVANAEGKCSSFSDDLSEDGVEQAKIARRTLSGHRWDVVIASTSPRAVATAQIVCGRPPGAIMIDGRCRERDFGLLEGLVHSEVLSRYPDVRYTVSQGINYCVDPPAGEFLEAVQARAADFLADLLARYTDREVAVFSHGNFLQQLHGYTRGLGPRQSLEQPLEHVYNLAMSTFDFDRDGHLVDSSHRLLVPAARLTGVY